MPVPPPPAVPMEIDLDPDDLVPEPEERSMSQTRRLGTNLKAHEELAVAARVSAIPAYAPSAPEADTQRVSKPPSDAMPSPDGAPAAKPYLSGDVIDGKYRLMRIIGRGGMGAVWAAHNIPLDIDVAITHNRRERTTGGAADRLLTEARAAARLMHPAIVRVFDFGETDQGDPFIVMELLRGESLNAILRRKRRLSAPVAVQTLLPVAAALASAHAKAIIHRDLKPDNILVVNDESGSLVPKIVDFGIAKLLSPELDRQVTLAGEVLGSPDYMSPEQARGADNVGEATDIWAFSVVLYEIIAGRRPFDGPNYNALIASILTDEPPPLTAHGVGDAALAGILAHGLAKEPSGRWPRMRDMGAALASWAVANGIEDDLMGNPIAKQWLSGGARRVLTVQPETGEPVLRSEPIAPAKPGDAQRPPPAAPAVSPSEAETQVGAYRPAGGGVRLAASIDARRTSANRALLMVVAIVLLGVAGVAAFLLRGRIAELRAMPADLPSADPSPAGTAPPVATAPAPTAVALPAAPVAMGDPGRVPQTPPDPVATASAAPSAEPAASAVPAASARVLGRFPRKNRAPAAPKNIKF